MVCYELRQPLRSVDAIVIPRYEPPAFAPAEPQPMFDEQPHWVEVQLVGDDDVGIAGAICELTLASGKVIRRRTNRHGIVRVEGFTSAGNCTVCFPEMDEEAWAPA